MFRKLLGGLLGQRYRISLEKSDSMRSITSAIYGKNQFAIKHFENWLLGLGGIYNFDVLDLFEWEQGHGTWLAMCQLEFDIAWKDIFTPFNCRSLLITMLSVKEKYRMPPKYELHKNSY